MQNMQLQLQYFGDLTNQFWIQYFPILLIHHDYAKCFLKLKYTISLTLSKLSNVVTLKQIEIVFVGPPFFS